MRKTKLTFFAVTFLKVSVFLITIIFLYHQLFVRESFISSWRLFLSQTEQYFPLYLIIPVIVLMIINWSVESIKWRFLLKKILNITFFHSLKAIILGVTISSFMPNRSGEFIGRMACVPGNYRIQSVFVSFIASISQFAITIIFGMAGLIFWAINVLYRHAFFNDYLLIVVIFICLLAIVLSLFFYFNIAFLQNVFKFFKIPKKWLKNLTLFKRYHRFELFIALILSLFRYLVFFFQYYLLLRLFNINISIFEGFLLISLIFMVMTIIPTIALLEIGVRSAVSVYFFKTWFLLKGVDVSSFVIMTPAIFLWLINIAIPSITGAFLLWNIKLVKNNISRV